MEGIVSDLTEEVSGQVAHRFEHGGLDEGFVEVLRVLLCDKEVIHRVLLAMDSV